jgi:thiamine kinase-like enzyme
MIDELLERVWPGRPATAEPLGGGITNRNFKVDVDGESFVLRIGGNDTHMLGIDRIMEHDASSIAASLGIAPEVVTFLEPEGFLVTRYVEGEVGHPDVVDAARLLRTLHDGPRIRGRFDSFRVVEAYAATAAGLGVQLPAAYASAKETADRIEPTRRSSQVTPCHNDLLAANFIFDGARLWIVDWEYAGMGDPFFDLGNFAVNHELDVDGEHALLSAYGSADADALVLMRFMSDFREAMWGVVQQGLSELEFDFVAYAGEHFERLASTAAELRFQRALRALAH